MRGLRAALLPTGEARRASLLVGEARQEVARRVSRIYPDGLVRALIRPGLVLAMAFAVAALPTAASGALSGPAALAAVAANSTTYQDSVGEDPAAPDITTIVVSNDDAGTLTFRVNTPNKAQYSSDVAVVLFIDSDANQSTGDPDSLGADYLVSLIQGEIILFKWDGLDFGVAATQASLSYSWAGGPTIRINASDLNNTRRLNFSVTTIAGVAFDPTTGTPDCTNCKRDFAPTIGFYRYDVKIGRPTLVVKRLTPTPKAPVAGRSFTLRLVAARSDTGAAVQNGKVTCLGRVGSARLQAQVQRVVGGAATCTWRIPASAKGKTFRGSVGVVFEGLRASQAYSGKVR